MAKLVAALTLALFALSGCVKSREAQCVAGYSDCGGVCVRTAVDPQSCGACGHVCRPFQDCVQGACVATCAKSLHAPVTDAWGNAWDGIERPATIFQAARDACATIGGRLPSATELYRVSAVKTAAVGSVYKTNAIWSITPDGSGQALGMTLSDGNAAAYPMTTSFPYRCVCPAARPSAFTGSACNGPVGAECAPLGGNGRFQFDAEDRPSMSKAAAIAECAFSGGDLPSAERLGAAAARGLPGGSGVELHSADDTGYVSSCVLWDCTFGCVCIQTADEEWEGLVSFTGTSPAFTEGAVQTPRPFRCFGPAAAGAVPASVPGGFLEPRGERTIDFGPDAASTTYSKAIADCLRKGGHLPTATELAAMAVQGLPAWSSTAASRLTADQGSPGSTVTFAWSGTATWPVDPDLAATTPTTDGVSYVWGPTSVYQISDADAAGAPYRCLYYGVDPSVAPPAASQCLGGCFEVDPGGGSSAARPRMWFDTTSRGGAAGDTYTSALATCSAGGGRLASTRDLVEAIRSGLGNPGGYAVVTSELAGGGPVARSLTWTLPSPSFSDTAGAIVPLTTTAVRYRCMWTNEIR
jgi:hypothetical protein